MIIKLEHKMLSRKVRVHHASTEDQRFAFNIQTGNYNVYITYPSGLTLKERNASRRSRVQRLRRCKIPNVNFFSNINANPYYPAKRETENSQCSCLSPQSYFNWIRNFQSQEIKPYEILTGIKFNLSPDGRYVFQNPSLSEIRAVGLAIHSLLLEFENDLTTKINDHLVIDEVYNELIISKRAYIGLCITLGSTSLVSDEIVKPKIPKGPYINIGNVNPGDFIQTHQQTLALMEHNPSPNKWDQFKESIGELDKQPLTVNDVLHWINVDYENENAAPATENEIKIGMKI